jgi:hypothetical protein
MRANLSSTLSGLCRHVMICWAVVINVTTWSSVNSSGACSAAFFWRFQLEARALLQLFKFKLLSNRLSVNQSVRQSVSQPVSLSVIQSLSKSVLASSTLWFPWPCFRCGCILLGAPCLTKGCLFHQPSCRHLSLLNIYIFSHSYNLQGTKYLS